MAELLKFCMITTFYPPYHFGGDAMYIYLLTNELARRGHQVDVIHCKDAYMLLRTDDALGEFPNHVNVRTYPLKSWAGSLSPLLTQQTGVPFFKRRAIKSLLKTEAYDVIHYHNTSLVGITALGYSDAVKLYTTHEHWLVCPMHVLWKFGREVCTTRSCTLCQIRGGRPPQLWRHTSLLRRMLRHVDCFIAPSRFTLKKQIELGLTVPIVHMPHFLPKRAGPISASTSKQSPNGGRPYFLFVGRLEKIKGVQNLIPIFRKRSEYDLLIAGAGEYEGALRSLSVGASNITFLGKLNQQRLAELYSGAVAALVPSICYETFSFVIIEAFSMKTPVIVNNLGALPELVADSGGGIVYNNNDELMRALDSLAKNFSLRNELGLKGYSGYLSRWTEDAHIEQYLQLITRLREQRRAEQLS
ncbi:MAG TPA: glycosyltransferase family 4 protein [Terriglobia bacterium]|nr:glycosyltransferase family 4 protein [Terriglobia bacterium]